MIAAVKDERLKPLHERPYTPGETFIIPEADPPGAPISGNPTPTPQSSSKEGRVQQEKADGPSS
jgi:hypothetical protein